MEGLGLLSYGDESQGYKEQEGPLAEPPPPESMGPDGGKMGSEDEWAPCNPAGDVQPSSCTLHSAAVPQWSKT